MIRNVTDFMNSHIRFCGHICRDIGVLKQWDKDSGLCNIPKCYPCDYDRDCGIYGTCCPFKAFQGRAGNYDQDKEAGSQLYYRVNATDSGIHFSVSDLEKISCVSSIPLQKPSKDHLDSGYHFMVIGSWNLDKERRGDNDDGDEYGAHDNGRDSGNDQEWME